ncbi:MAG TPA: DUF4178 domain-containing protein [Arcobacter sp.]|nr:DUF4178 domain-containing protein [Arcobacter sp.]
MSVVNYDELFTITRKLTNVIPSNKRKTKDLFSIKEGTFLEFKDKTFFVKESITYSEKNKKGKIVDSWDECEAICLEEKGKTYFVEVEDDDGLKIYFSHTIVKLRELGIKKSDIKQIVDEEDNIKYNNQKFYYDDDYIAFLGNSDEKVYFVDFEADNGDYLTIEQYEDGETKAYISSSVSGVEVIQA